jgi:hypothetical protein
MLVKFGKLYDKLVNMVEKMPTEDSAYRAPSSDTFFRDTDIGARIEFTDGKMIYWIILEGSRIQD